VSDTNLCTLGVDPASGYPYLSFGGLGRVVIVLLSDGLLLRQRGVLVYVELSSNLISLRPGELCLGLRELTVGLRELRFSLRCELACPSCP